MNEIVRLKLKELRSQNEQYRQKQELINSIRKIEAKSTLLSAQTERLKQLLKHYGQYMNRLYPSQDSSFSTYRPSDDYRQPDFRVTSSARPTKLADLPKSYSQSIETHLTKLNERVAHLTSTRYPYVTRYTHKTEISTQVDDYTLKPTLRNSYDRYSTNSLYSSYPTQSYSKPPRYLTRSYTLNSVPRSKPKLSRSTFEFPRYNSLHNDVYSKPKYETYDPNRYSNNYSSWSRLSVPVRSYSFREREPRRDTFNFSSSPTPSLSRWRTSHLDDQDRLMDEQLDYYSRKILDGEHKIASIEKEIDLKLAKLESEYKSNRPLKKSDSCTSFSEQEPEPLTPKKPLKLGRSKSFLDEENSPPTRLLKKPIHSSLDHLSKDVTVDVSTLKDYLTKDFSETKLIAEDSESEKFAEDTSLIVDDENEVLPPIQNGERLEKEAPEDVQEKTSRTNSNNGSKDDLLPESTEEDKIIEDKISDDVKPKEDSDHLELAGDQEEDKRSTKDDSDEAKQEIDEEVQEPVEDETKQEEEPKYEGEWSEQTYAQPEGYEQQYEQNPTWDQGEYQANAEDGQANWTGEGYPEGQAYSQEYAEQYAGQYDPNYVQDPNWEGATDPANYEGWTEDPNNMNIVYDADGNPYYTGGDYNPEDPQYAGTDYQYNIPQEQDTTNQEQNSNYQDYESSDVQNYETTDQPHPDQTNEPQEPQEPQEETDQTQDYAYEYENQTNVEPPPEPISAPEDNVTPQVPEETPQTPEIVQETNSSDAPSQE